MSQDRTETVSNLPQEISRTPAEIIEELARFEGSPEEFLTRLLGCQCHLGRANAGAILRVVANGQPSVLAIHPGLPAGSVAPAWLSRAAELSGEVAASGQSRVVPLHSPDDLYGRPAPRHLVLLPMRAEGFQGLAAFVVETEEAAIVSARRDRLEMMVGYLSLYDLRQSLRRRQADLVRLREALEVLPAVNEQDRFMAAAMALCNEATARWNCERVSLGFLKGRYVHLRAMSHTEKFSRKMKLVQDIESAMEECLDQDTEILFPAPADASYVSRVTAELSRRYGPMAVAALPLRKNGEVVAVALLERRMEGEEGGAFTLDELESIRLACDLCTPRLVSLHESDRWFGARMEQSTRKALAGAMGPKHTWKKVAAIAVFAVVLFLIFAKGTYRAEAPFTLEATQLLIAPAPFDGYLKEVFVDPGDDVVGGKTVLATLDTSELRLKLAASRADREAYRRQAAAAMKEDKRAEAMIANAQADRVSAEIALVEHQIGQASIVSPISGKVVRGDLRRQVGAPVKTGDVLFEVAPVDALRAEMSVPEDEIADVNNVFKDAKANRQAAEEAKLAGKEVDASKPVQVKGELASASFPERRVGFVVERITPRGEVVNQRNVFKVRGQLEKIEPWMRPGMEGLAKVEIGRRHYAWIWTRRMINWVRMKFWW